MNQACNTIFTNKHESRDHGTNCSPAGQVKRMKSNIFVLILILFITSCASLTKTQIETVNQFAQTTKNFSAFPSKIITGLADVRTIRGIYAANSIGTPEFHLKELDNTY